jgi:hypothetical protein
VLGRPSANLVTIIVGACAIAVVTRVRSRLVVLVAVPMLSESAALVA